MRLQNWIAAGLLAVTVAVPAAPAADPAPGTPTLLVRLKSIDGLLADAKYLAGLAGHEEQATQLEKTLPQFLGPKGLAGTGLDTSKPWGLYAILDPQIPNSPAVALVPVADEEAFVNTLKMAAGFAPGGSVKITKGDDDIYTVNSPAPVEVYFTVADGYAYVTALRKESITKANRLSAGKLLPADDKTLVRATLRLDTIDPTIKQMALGHFENLVAAAKEQHKPHETAAQKKLRGDVIDYLSGQVKSLLSDGQAVDFQVTLDRKADDLSAQFSLSPKPGSPLAKAIAKMNKRESRFAPVNGAAGYLALNVAVPEALRGPLMSALEEGFKQQQAGQKDAVKKDLAQKVYDAVKPTVSAGQLDVFFVLVGPNSAGKYTAAGGIKLKDAGRVDQLVRDLINVVPDPKAKEAIHLDAETIGDVKVHKIVPPEIDPETKRVFGGDATAVFAFPADAQVAAFGSDASKVLRKIIASPGQAGEPFRAEGSIARLSALDKNAGDTAKKAADVAFGSDKSADVVHVTLSGGQSLRLQASVKTQVVKFIAKMDEAKKDGE